ncbi:MAG: diguanylate cyclase [Pseudomonadota bacterium]
MSEDESARLINVSGRQRMLSQQITLLTREYVNAEGAAPQVQAEVALREALSEFRDAHRALTEGDKALALPPLKSPVIREIYTAEDSLNDLVKWFVDEVEGILDHPPDAPALRGRIDALSSFARTTLLNRLDDVVTDYEAQSHARLRTILRIDIIIFALTLLLLVLEGQFIFRPMARDVAKRTRQLQQARDQLDQQANHDELTGLPNRRYLRGVAGEELISNRPQAVLQIDLDGFKQVNDLYGHAAGDALLKEVGGRMKRALRESDFLARTGGDEFVVVLSQMECEDDHALVAQRLIDRIAEPVTVAGRTVQVGASVGVALAGDRELPFYELLGEADVALYEVKRGGKGTWEAYRAEGVRGDAGRSNRRESTAAPGYPLAAPAQTR